jgi:hypothetical protein
MNTSSSVSQQLACVRGLVRLAGCHDSQYVIEVIDFKFGWQAR